MKRGDAAVALKISGIECENTLHRVDAHRGNEPGIIDFDALDLVVSHNLFPSGVDRRDVRQQS